MNNKIYIVKRWLWDQWDNYGNGSTKDLKLFTSKDDAYAFLSKINVDKDLEDEESYVDLKMLKNVSGRRDLREYIIPGPIGEDVDVVYYVKEVTVQLSVV